MQRLLIMVMNGAWLALLLVGVPAVAGLRLWNWELSSVPVAQMLVFGGLALAASGNGFSALFLVKGRKERKLCWEWAGVFVGLLLVQNAYFHGYFNFNWLKRTLVWLQNHS